MLSFATHVARDNIQCFFCLFSFLFTFSSLLSEELFLDVVFWTLPSAPLDCGTWVGEPTNRVVLQKTFLQLSCLSQLEH